jgi:hypothetical protein
MMEGTSKDGSNPLRSGLRPRPSIVGRPESPENPAKATKREHHIKEKKELEMKTDMGLSDDENEPPTEDTVGEVQDSVKTERVKFLVSYGARAETKDEGNNEYFMCDSGGKKSPTQHLKEEAHKVTVPFGLQEAIPIVEAMLSKMQIPVNLNLENHQLARPLPEAVFLDPGVAMPLRFHKLEPLEPEWSSRGPYVSICVFDKV